MVIWLSITHLLYLSVSGYIWTGSVNQEPKEEAVDIRKRKAKELIIEKPNRGSNIRRSQDCSLFENRSLVISASVEQEKETRSSLQPTIDFCPRSSSVFRHMNSDPSPYGAHLLTAVTKKCLELL